MQTSEIPPRHYPTIPYWLIVRGEGDEIERLVMDAGGEPALPVFSYEEEAEMYLRLANPGTEWRIRETTSGELVSMLFGPCASVGLVALDPLPELSSRGVVGLVSISAQRFAEHLVKAHPSVI